MGVCFRAWGHRRSRKSRPGLPGARWWSAKGTRSGGSFVFLGSFPDAIAFVTRLAFDAEAADHHPDIVINYKRVTLTFRPTAKAGSRRKTSRARVVYAVAA